MRGVTLDEIAESTKIGTRLLRALEEEQFDLLPGGIFNKGFVRAYAKYLGMDEDQAVADYLQAAGNEEPDVQLIAQQGDWSDTRYPEPRRTESRGFPFIPVLVLIVVVAAGFGGWKIYQQHMQEREAWRAEREASQSSGSTTATSPVPSDVGQSVTPKSSAAVSPQPAASTEPPSPALVANSSPIASASASGFEVEVKTTGRAWVSLKADGKILVRGVLDADQSRTLHADKEIIVWTGNAGATQVSFEGKPVTMEGGTNETRVLVFKPNGLQSTPPPLTRPSTEPPTEPTAEPSAPRQ